MTSWGKSSARVGPNPKKPFHSHFQCNGGKMNGFFFIYVHNPSIILVYLLFENSITFRYATNTSNTVHSWSIIKTSVTVLNPYKPSTSLNLPNPTARTFLQLLFVQMLTDFVGNLIMINLQMARERVRSMETVWIKLLKFTWNSINQPQP